MTQMTRFARAAAKLKPPTSASFVLQEWTDTFAAGPITEEDQQLLDAAVWISAEAAAAAKAFRNPTFPLLSAEWSTILAVAALNREYRTAVELHTDAAKAAVKDGMLAVDAIAGLQIPGAAGQELTLAEIAEVGTDLTENWLYDAAASTGAEGANIADLAPTAVYATKFYSFRKMLNILWNEAWHAGSYIQSNGSGSYRWCPRDRQREELEFAWRCRQSANLMNFPAIDRTVWPKLSPSDRRKRARKFSVTGINSTKKVEIQVGAISYLSRHMPAYVYEKGALEGSYVANFVDSPLRTDQGLSAALLLQAWHVVVDIARLLAAQTPLPDTLTPEGARKLALTIDRASLVGALSRALKVAPEQADAIVAFLAFEFQVGGQRKEKGNKGLWAAPLVPVPGSTDVLLPLPVLLTSNVARRAEAWLEKGGINDDNPAGARGDRYEAFLRSEITNAIAGNRLFTTACSSVNGIKKDASFDEQIDLLVVVGSLALVGEVKFFLMPTDPHEKKRFDHKLREAAEQARRKATALQGRPDVTARAVGIELARASSLRLLPIVVTNQDYGFSTRVEGVLIINAKFLRLYFGGGDILSEMAFTSAGGRSITRTMTLYHDEEGAARCFETEMSSPRVLSRFLSRIDWSAVVIPTLAHGPTSKDIPVLRDVTGSERSLAQMLTAGLPHRN